MKFIIEFLIRNYKRKFVRLLDKYLKSNQEISFTTKVLRFRSENMQYSNIINYIVSLFEKKCTLKELLHLRKAIKLIKKTIEDDS